MITEDYVSFEVAKLLKEKGFDIPCIGQYSTRSKDFHLDSTRQCNNGGLFTISAPTLQMAMKWLREVRNIFVDIYYDCEFGQGYRFSIEKLPKGTILNTSDLFCDTYEEAAEAAIKYLLKNLI